MTAIANLPDLRPSLLLDFANSGRVDPRIQFTRASAATCWGSDGQLRTVAANVPRIDYDPATGKCLGLLVEEARTNYIRDSGDLSAATWVKSDIAAEASDGWNKLTYQGTGSYRSAYQTLGTPMHGKKCVFSVEVKAGSHTRMALLLACDTTATIGARLDLNLTTGQIVSITSSGGIIPAGLFEAVIKPLKEGWFVTLFVDFTGQAPANPGTRVYIYPGVFSNQTVGNIYVRRCQVEEGTFPTSYIPTEASAVTRAADVPVLQEQLMPAFGTMLVKYRNAGWKYTNTKPVGNLDLSKRVDTGAQNNDHIERAMLYQRQLTATQIQRLTA